MSAHQATGVGRPRGSSLNIVVEPDAGDGQLKFSVSDDGPGIPPEEIPFVFNKYYRVSGIRNQVDGADLGLSISKHIVETHGGTIWVESQERQDSTFCFALPLSRRVRE